ncbi:MAG: RNA polymerase sigma factor [Chloroflexota bacterium]
MKEKEDKFLELFNPVKQSLWKYCLSVSHSRDSAKDLLQETIETAYRQFGAMRNEQAFLSYLFTIASRIYARSRERNRRQTPCDPADFEYVAASTASPEQAADAAILHAALAELPHDQGEAIILQELMGFSQAEICVIQGINLETLKKRLYRAKNKLRELLTERIPTLQHEGAEK